MKVKRESEVAQSCQTLSDPTHCSLPGSSVHGIFQAGALEWGATAFSQKQNIRKTRHTQREDTGCHMQALAMGVHVSCQEVFGRL